MTAATSFVDAYAPHGPYVHPVRIRPHRPMRTQPAPSPQGHGVIGGRMSEYTGNVVSVKIIPNEKGSPPGKLADAEVIFEADAGPLSGLKLLGFAVWDRRDGGEERDVPRPAVLHQRRTPEFC